MAIIVEDGTGVVNANSLVDSSAATTFLSERGFTLPASLTDYDTSLLKAMDVLKYRSYHGTKATTTNDLPFPRISCPNRFGEDYAEDEIPAEAIEAQIWLAHYISTGTDLVGKPKPAKKSSKVDVITTVWAVVNGQTDQVRLRDLPNVYAPLKHLLAQTSTAFGRTQRA